MPGAPAGLSAPTGCKIRVNPRPDRAMQLAGTAPGVRFMVQPIMKTKACFIKTLFLAAFLGSAGPLLAQDTSTASGMQKTDTTKGKSLAPVPKVPVKAVEVAKIEGIVLNRPNGGFLGLTLDDHKFKLSFYDAKKKPAKVDVALANARWPVHYSIYDEHAVLMPNADGTALTSPKYVRPPYAFKLFLNLIPEGDGKQVEPYVIDFHQ